MLPPEQRNGSRLEIVRKVVRATFMVGFKFGQRLNNLSDIVRTVVGRPSADHS